MKAIVTKYHGATDTRGSRISAKAEGLPSVSVPYPHEFSGEEAHWQAVKALCAKMGWKGRMHAGGNVKDDGYTFVFVAGPARKL